MRRWGTSSTRFAASRCGNRRGRRARQGYYQTDPEFEEPHRRGEILVAAMMNAFLGVWTRRLKTLGDGESRSCTASGLPRKAAGLLTTCSR